VIDVTIKFISGLHTMKSFTILWNLKLKIMMFLKFNIIQRSHQNYQVYNKKIKRIF